MSRVTTQLPSSGSIRYDTITALGFRPAELRRIGSIIAEQQAALLKAWHEYFAK
jgi:hypothetical protein